MRRPVLASTLPGVFALTSMLCAAPAVAQSTTAVVASPAPSGVAPRLRLDPGMPPDSARKAALAEKRTGRASSGAALDADVERQLRSSFDVADLHHAGTLTRAQAQAGGFGYVARHFDAIDTRHAGAVSFDDVKRYLRSRGARHVDR